jgi:hypothetical protein
MRAGQGAFGRDAAEALARAYLAGQGDDGEIVQIEPPGAVYRVSFRAGEQSGVLLVDAVSGDVTLEAAPE